MGTLSREDAEEYTQTIEQFGDGWARQLALGIKIGVPDSLGMQRREWANRIGVKPRDRLAQVSIEVELRSEGLTNREISDVVGVSHQTVGRDLNGPNGPLGDTEPERDEELSGPNGPPETSEPSSETFSAGEYEEEESEEENRFRELQELNEETRQAKLYASLFYMPAREVSKMIDDGEKAGDIVRIMRRRRYVLKVEVTPIELRKAGEMFLRLSREESR